MIVKEVLEAAMSLARDRAAEATAWDARILLAHAMGGLNPLGLDPREELDPAAEARFEALWDERLKGVPVQHLVGEWDFCGRPFLVDRRGLIPRPETEVLMFTALREAPHASRALDAGTGSGILAVTFLQERPGARAMALDASLEALTLARANGARHGVLDRLDLLCSDWLSAVGEATFDLALSNPPYLAVSEEKNLSATVGQYDPRSALFAGEDGLAAIRQLLDDVPNYLELGCPFLFEIGYGQAEDVTREILRRPIWHFVGIELDLASIPRVVIVRKTA